MDATTSARSKLCGVGPTSISMPCRATLARCAASHWLHSSTITRSGSGGGASSASSQCVCTNAAARSARVLYELTITDDAAHVGGGGVHVDVHSRGGGGALWPHVCCDCLGAPGLKAGCRRVGKGRRAKLAIEIVVDKAAIGSVSRWVCEECFDGERRVLLCELRRAQLQALEDPYAGVLVSVSATRDNHAWTRREGIGGAEKIREGAEPHIVVEISFAHARPSARKKVDLKGPRAQLQNRAFLG